MKTTIWQFLDKLNLVLGLVFSTWVKRIILAPDYRKPWFVFQIFCPNLWFSSSQSNLIYIVQKLFHQGKGSRSISKNSHYLVLFKNPRDKLQILTLAKQMYPGQTDFFLNQYEEAVKRPFGYLLIDLKTTTQDNCRLHTNVLPSEEGLNQAGCWGLKCNNCP